MRRAMIYLADVAVWCGAFAAYWLIVLLPLGERRTAYGRVMWWLLPWAGYYGFHESWMEWRWSRRRSGWRR